LEKLYPYLSDIEKQAEKLFLELVKALADKENITEEFKSENSMLWMQNMNSGIKKKNCSCRKPTRIAFVSA